MKKLILVDGNNLLFRSFYATLYTGNLMKTSKGVVTNAVFGLVNMMHKIIEEEKPEYILVAFDKGKTFRHDQYEDYKAKRMEMPNELRGQFPIAKEILTAMGVHYTEVDNYEADDIIGTYTKIVDNTDDFKATIISSDKDLLQLISDDVDIKLLKQKDYIRYNLDSFIKEYGFDPIHMIDLKALQGDASDNIKGVRGVGEKTALKLINEYKTIENLYDSLDDIKGALKDKLISGREDAFVSKDLCTIYTETPLTFSLEELIFNGPDKSKLTELYKELEFNSFLRNLDQNKPVQELKFKTITDIKELTIPSEYVLYFEYNNKNYHFGNLLGIGFASDEELAFIPKEIFLANINLFKGKITTYHAKSIYCYPGCHDLNITDDIMLMAYINNYTIKDDIGVLASAFGVSIPAYNKKQNDAEITENICRKARFILEVKDELKAKLKQEELLTLYNTIELPLIKVLADMEINGITTDINVLEEISNDLEQRLSIIEEQIFKIVGHEFNISSPKQLGDVLFVKLGLTGGKKTKTGYSTDRDALDKISSQHEIVPLIIGYRTLAKVNSTYATGLKPFIKNGKIHPIFNQTLTRTGRLSCMEPNLQNIPIRNEEGRIIRKAFLPSEDNILMGSDYSQIELRIFAHLSDVDVLKEAFISGKDIHTRTAMDVYKVNEGDVTEEMRRVAKAVNFGIIYGISSFGLSNNIGTDIIQAKQFMKEYLSAYPGVKNYMDQVIERARVDGYVTTLYHRKRVIDELSSNNYMIRSMGERMALNTPIQGTSADIIKVAMIQIAEELSKRKMQSKMILQVHDELIFDVVPEEKALLQKLVTETMENVIKLNVPLLVQTDFGKNWYDIK